MIRFYIKKFILVVLFFLPLFMMAQIVKGTVTDKNGKILPYTKVTEYRATNKAMSSEDGSFSIRVSMLPTKLIFKAIGYKEIMIAVSKENAVSVSLEENELGVKEQMNVGNLTNSRTIYKSPVAITHLSKNDINATGRVSLEDVLAYSEASFNSTNQSHADLTTHFDVADLKGLGSSRMLILVNGKRKNLGAFTQITDTYGKGEVGVDLKNIPVAAIERIEILREGASSIYGSDAIAGVINIVLKEKTDINVVNVNGGMTSKGDGLAVGGDVNGTFSNDKGDYVNYTVSIQHQEFTDRAGEPGEDKLFGVSSADSWIKENADLGMTIGQPTIDMGNVYFNAKKPFKNGKGAFYGTVGVGFKQVKSSTFFLAPYMGTDSDNIYQNQGYEPSLNTVTLDNMDVLGLTYTTNGFDIDFSLSYGINDIGVFVENSLNPSMGATSHLDFDNGLYRFKNAIANVNVKKSFDKLHVVFGSEYGFENFVTKQGVYDSWFYTTTNGLGVYGFNGISHTNEVDKDRSDIGVYTSLDYDISDEFLIGASARYDNYDDVGDQISYKINTRYSIGGKGAVRASYGTSFRAPALQQMYMNYTTNNSSLVLNEVQRTSLGIADLEAETATNINVGIYFEPIDHLSLSLDYYKVDIDNRVVLSNDLSDTISVDPYEQILADNDVSSIRFFTNAINTASQGVDFLAKYDNIRFPKGVLGFSLAANWNTTEIVGDTKKPDAVKNYDIFNRTERSRIETGRPSIKGKFGINYEQHAFKVAFNNSYYGEATWKHATDENKDQTFGGKVLTDVLLDYKISKRINLNLSVNNILNVYPDEIETKGDVMMDSGGRFLYSRELSQFGILGMNIHGGISVKF